MRWLRAAVIVLATTAGPVLAQEPLEVVARIGIGAEPLGLAVTGDNRILVVAAAERALYAIDATRHQTISRLDLAAHGRLNRVIADPDGRAIYVTASVAGKLLVIDWDLGAVRAAIVVGTFPQGMAILDRRLFVANTADQSISVFDTGVRPIECAKSSGFKPLWSARLIATQLSSKSACIVEPTLAPLQNTSAGRPSM